MRRVRHRWQQFGNLAALVVVGPFFALSLLAALALANSTAIPVVVALFAVVVLYCFARRSGGWAVFSSAAGPGAAGTLLHHIAGAPEWIGVLFIPIALLAVWDQDREGAGNAAPST